MQIKLCYIAADVFIKCIHRSEGLSETLTGVSIRGGGYVGRVYGERRLFIYYYSTSTLTSRRLNKKRQQFYAQVPCCLILHHIICQLCLSQQNCWAFNVDEL